MVTFPQEKGFSSLFTVIFISTILLLTGCAGNDVIDSEVVDVSVSETDPEVVEVDIEEESEVDPYEGFNRSMYGFNDTLDTYVAEPISDAYLWVTPRFVQTGIHNFFSNLKDINVVLNDVMQGKGGQGVDDTGRFLVNSTLGLAGLFDVATEIGLDKHEEDFAQTLAVWGVPQGPYLVLPLLGPATTRGVPGGIFDAAANPASYVGMPVQLLQMLNARANAEGSLNFIDEASLDPYVFTREAFLQHRDYLISDGESEVSGDLLDLEDDFYDDDDLLDDPVDDDVSSKDEKGSEVVIEVPVKTDDAIEKQVEDPKQQLELRSEAESFDEATTSFDGAVESFDEASRSFEEANEKLNQIKN